MLGHSGHQILAVVYPLVSRARAGGVLDVCPEPPACQGAELRRGKGVPQLSGWEDKGPASDPFPALREPSRSLFFLARVSHVVGSFAFGQEPGISLFLSCPEKRCSDLPNQSGFLIDQNYH